MVYFRDEADAPCLSRGLSAVSSSDTLVDAERSKQSEETQCSDFLEKPPAWQSQSQQQQQHQPHGARARSANWKRLAVALGGFFTLIALAAGVHTQAPELAANLQHSFQFAQSSTPSSHNTGRQAIAVLLTDATWIPQMSVLAYSLDKFSSNRDRIAIIPDNMINDPKRFPNDSIAVVSDKLGWKIAAMPFIGLPKGSQVAHAGYENVMNKLWIWNMTEYDGGIGFLDLDGLVVGSLDTAFDILRVSNVSLASIPDQGIGYDQVRASPQAGSMWAMPNTEVFNDMMVFKNDTSLYDTRYPEQLMLNRFFWGRWTVMPAKFGLQMNFGVRKDWNKLRPDAAFLHFADKVKPWKSQKAWWTIQRDVDLWRENFVNATRDYGLTLSDLTSGQQLGWDVRALSKAS